MSERWTLETLQEDQREWVARNFGDRPSWHPLLGVGEELGELMHAHLKTVQGIRGSRMEHHRAKVDAVADIVIYLADYCSAEGIDLADAVDETWSKVRKRDWRKDPQRGGT